MRAVISAIEGEYRRYRTLGRGAMGQLSGGQLCTRVSAESLSVAMIVWHLSGNFKSRFTDFLTTDGEKVWRERDDEFSVRTVTGDEVIARWDEGWDVLVETLGGLTDEKLSSVVLVRGVELTVVEALERSLGHTAYHVGQITFLGKMLTGEGWDYLSIPPGGTAVYNANPTHEKM